MKIKLWPAISEEPMVASVSGDVITINGQAFDFSPLKDGQRLPSAAASVEFFVEGEFIERVGKTLYMTIRFPVQWDTPTEVMNPKENMVIDARSGQVKFPSTRPAVTGVPEIEEEQTND